MRMPIFAAALVLSSVAAGAQSSAPPAAEPSLAGRATTAAGAIAGKVLGAPAAAPAATATKTATVNINTATAAQLDDLPQIGPARAKAIIAGRPYKSTKELLDRKIVPAHVYDLIKAQVAI